MDKIFSIILLFGLILVSCTDPNTIGLEVQPESDNIIINAVNFDGLNSSTEAEDSLRTDEALNLVLGEINDPVFGYNSSFFYTQILLTENNTDLGNNPNVDSVILSYSYLGSYNNGQSKLNSVDVFMLQEKIYKDSVYYSTSYQNPISSSMSYVESFSVSEDTENPQLKVRLTPEFGDYIFELNNDGLIDNEVFLDNFNGISVFATAENTMFYLNPNGSKSYLKIYYSNDESGSDTLFLDFELGGDAARINLFNSKSLDDLYQEPEKLYIQSMAGFKSKVTVGNLEFLKDTLKGKAINKVTITFSTLAGTISDYEAHEKLALVRVNQDGNNVFLSDFTIEGEAHFGGGLVNDKYEFNITRYFYQLLNNESYTGDLYLLPAGAAVNANRTVLSKDILLNIHYSEL